MTNNKTKAYKSYYGWQAESFIDLDFNGLVLNIVTSKRHNGMLSTTVNAGREEKGFFSTFIFQDYNKTLVQEKVKVTEKAVINQHNSIDIESIKQSVIAFYQQQDSA